MSSPIFELRNNEQLFLFATMCDCLDVQYSIISPEGLTIKIYAPYALEVRLRSIWDSIPKHIMSNMEDHLHEMAIGDLCSQHGFNGVVLPYEVLKAGNHPDAEPGK